ncbi:MAG TPA: M12 family metallo-peptidase [Saprospiraceae bacterium]|nr:M12 family metallo-peptidase [Saprospiraceae bacterium]
MIHYYLLRRMALLLPVVFLGLPSFSQNNFFRVLAHEKTRSDYPVKPSILKYALMRIDEAGLRQYVATAPMEFEDDGPGMPLEIPLPNGQTEVFLIHESPILAPAIAAEHPDIKTYTGHGSKHAERVIRFSLTCNGFGGIILNVNGDAVYFESYERGSGMYLCYNVGDVRTPDRAPIYRCGVDSPHDLSGRMPGGMSADYRNNTGATLRTYDLAIAADAEFTLHPQYGNGNVNTAYAYIVNFVNNMAAVYRVEMCVSFTLVTGTNLVYTDVVNDPYNNANQGTMLSQNQTNLDNVVGSANYDVGHVFGYIGGSGGGVASLESVCYSVEKGRGVSSMCDLNSYPQVYNDQLVYHEIGHQFGMNHSYNSSIPVCTTRNPGTSVEPGSGATIMSYGFTCGSDDYESTYGPILQFHTVNYEEAYTYFTNTSPGWGGSCPTNTSTGNSLPSISMPSAITIPNQTPFSLTGSATDPNGSDALTFCWEGTNVGTVTPNAGTLNNTAQPPFFRSYSPESSGERIYPRLEKILDQTYQGIGDKLPSVGVTTTHRLTVRDNRETGGATVNSSVSITVSGSIGPFYVNNLNNSYTPNSSATITWNVGGTTGAPVSCNNIDILFSSDGGYTFPITLAANTPNNGTRSVIMPNLNTTTARVMIRAVNNIFFDISNEFEVQGPLPVELLNFQVQAKNRRDALLTWQTASETANQGFEIEMAAGVGLEFKKMGFVAADARYDYTFTVPQLTNGSYLFRLRQLDLDGTFEYSPIRTLTIETDEPSVTMFPTPASGALNIAFSRFGEKNISLQIVNQIGQTVKTLELPAETEMIATDVSSLPAGVYVIIIRSGGISVNSRFVKE